MEAEFYTAEESGYLAAFRSYSTEVFSIQDVGPMKDTRGSHIYETYSDIIEHIKNLRGSDSGIQKSPFLGVESTERKITMRTFVMYELENY